MKVAFVNSVYGFGSTGKIIMSLCNCNKIEAKAFYGRKEKINDDHSYKFNNLIGNINQAIQTYVFDNHGFSCTMATKKLIKELKNFQPDIIHLHNLHGYYINVEILFSYLKRNNIKVIWTLHDCWAFTGHCPHFEAINCFQWKNVCKKCLITGKYPSSFNKLNVNKNYIRKKEIFTSLPIDNLTIVTPSKWLKDCVEQSFLSKYRAIVINNGIDVSKFSKQMIKENNKFRIIAVSSIWYKEKGLEDLKQLSNLLTSNMELVVIGLKRKQFVGFSTNTICLERTNNMEELINYYLSSDVFVNLTYEDTFPTVNIEAMACGLPILSYKSGGSTEMIDIDTGLIIDKYDINALYDAIVKLYKGYIKFDRNKIIEHAKIYNEEKMYCKYLELYKELLYGKNNKNMLD